MDGKINQSLNDTSSTLTTIIQSDNFVNLAPQTQTSIIEAVHDDKGKGAGFVGKFLGVNTQNAAIHFAFIICLLLFALILITMIYAWVTNGTMNVELIGTFYLQFHFLLVIFLVREHQTKQMSHILEDIIKCAYFY